MIKMDKRVKVPLQDAFLAALCRERIPVSIFLLNGLKLQGLIIAHDQFTVLLKLEVGRLVYKSLIASVVPLQAVRNWKPAKLSAAMDPLHQAGP